MMPGSNRHIDALLYRILNKIGDKMLPGVILARVNFMLIVNSIDKLHNWL